jgi:hypothetical protein
MSQVQKHFVSTRPFEPDSFNTQAKSIIADNLSKAGWSWAASQRLIPTGERSGLLTRIATMERVWLHERMKSSPRFWNWKRHSSCRLSPFLSFTLQHFASDNSKAGAASPAADKELATFGNGIFCVVVAFRRVLPNGGPHRVVLVHVVNVYLCKTRVSPTATRRYTNPCTIGEVT